MGRLDLLKYPAERAADLDVDVRFDRQITGLDALEADLIVGADGLNSLVRRSDEDGFGVSVEYFDNRFAWFGTPRPFDTLTQTFVRTDKGTLNAHHYRYTPQMSTFIVECDPATFEAYRFGDKNEEETARICEGVFADYAGRRAARHQPLDLAPVSAPVVPATGCRAIAS